MKNFTRITGIIAMVAIMALAVSCSKNEASGGTNGGNGSSAAGGSGVADIGKLNEEWAALNTKIKEAQELIMQQSNPTEKDIAAVVAQEAQLAEIAGRIQNAWADASAQGASYTGLSETLSKSEQFEYELTDDGTGVRIERLLLETRGIPIIINVPAEIEGYPVVEIGESAFSGNRITSVTLPDSVKKFGEEALSGTRITTIALPSNLTEIGESCFSESSITSITIPENVTTIRDDAFTRCNNLTEIVIPGKVTELGFSVFWECENLTEVTILEGLTTIKGTTFNRCAKLTTVTIPESVTSIGGWAFRSCSELTTVNLPSHPIRYTGEQNEHAFGGCPKLTLAMRKKIQDTGYKGTF